MYEYMICMRGCTHYVFRMRRVQTARGIEQL